MKVSQALMNNVKIQGYSAIEKLVFACNGTIFGGYVRDEYIKEYYTDKFSKELYRRVGGDAFWNKRMSPSTSARTIIASDMDICFPNNADADKFIDRVKETSEFTFVVVKTKNAYISPQMISAHYTVRICMKVGVIPFISEGEDLMLDLDMIVANTLPPFGNLDMLCNGFIKTKEGKRFSRNTGTKLDKLSEFEHHREVMKILEDMMEFKTTLCFTQKRLTKKDLNISALKRIQKMEKKDFSWTFTNMPINIECYSDEGLIEDTCCICFEQFVNGEKISYTASKKEDKEIPASKMHYKCCMKYLEHQMDTVINTISSSPYEFTFRCPCRNKIDFSTCKI